MMRLALRRLAQGALTVLFASLIAFALFRFVGDPVNTFAAQDASPAERRQVASRLGLDDPLPLQFARFVGSAATLDFGISYRHRRPVFDIVAERLPASVELTVAGMTLAVALGIPGGILCALRRRWLISRALTGFAAVGVALPTFVTGLGLIFIFGITLGWLPTHGRGEVVALGAWTTGLVTRSGLAALVLPAMTLALFQLALLLRLSRAQVAAGLASEFVTSARARGLSPPSILIRHVLPNAAAPIVTVIGLQTGAVLAFSAITEQVFQWPGLGLLFLQAIADADMPVISAYLCFVAVMFVGVNLLVDLACCAIDPRWPAR
jgi:peptide/nickel transport system permease protein